MMLILIILTVTLGLSILIPIVAISVKGDVAPTAEAVKVREAMLDILKQMLVGVLAACTGIIATILTNDKNKLP